MLIVLTDAEWLALRDKATRDQGSESQDLTANHREFSAACWQIVRNRNMADQQIGDFAPMIVCFNDQKGRLLITEVEEVPCL